MPSSWSCSSCPGSSLARTAGLACRRAHPPMPSPPAMYPGHQLVEAAAVCEVQAHFVGGALPCDGPSVGAPPRVQLPQRDVSFGVVPEPVDEGADEAGDGAVRDDSLPAARTTGGPSAADDARDAGCGMREPPGRRCGRFPWQAPDGAGSPRLARTCGIGFRVDGSPRWRAPPRPGIGVGRRRNLRCRGGGCGGGPADVVTPADFGAALNVLLGDVWKCYEKQLPGHRVQIDVKFVEPPPAPPPGAAATATSTSSSPPSTTTRCRRLPTTAERGGSRPLREPCRRPGLGRSGPSAPGSPPGSRCNATDERGRTRPHPHGYRP